MKIIFLDIDGVLWNYDSSYPKDEYGFLFKQKCVEALEFLISETQSKIVITSSWKNMGLSTLQKMWNDRNLPKPIISVTPDFSHKHIDFINQNDPFKLSRGYEIEQWLKQNTEVSNYLIIDDLNDFTKEQEKHLIMPKPNVGLTLELAKIGIDILNT